MLVILILKGGKCVGKNEITDFDKYVSERYTTTIAKRFGTIAKLFNQYMCDNGLKAEAVTEQDIKDFISSKEKLRMTEYLMCSAIKCYGEYLGLNNIIGVDELKYSNHVFRTANSIKLSISTIEQDLLRLGTNVKVLRDSGKVDLLKNGHTVAEVLELAGTDNYDAVIKLYKHVL